jgi:hypothetical protein
MAATRRRRVAAAHGQSRRNATSVAGFAGNATEPVTVHQSVNSSQIRSYPLGGRAGGVGSVLVIGQRPMRVTALPISGACSLDCADVLVEAVGDVPVVKVLEDMVHKGVFRVSRA